jgi:hypothetical protein
LARRGMKAKLKSWIMLFVLLAVCNSSGEGSGGRGREGRMGGKKGGKKGGWRREEGKMG